MTPLKFRAWDGKRMWKVLSLSLNGRPTATLQFKPIVKVWINDLQLMQSTGLTDLNGKEIFEGDILRALAPRGPFDSDRYEGKVVYAVDMGMWEFRAIKVPLDLCPLKFASDPEVIGNVWETPELLSPSDRDRQ